MKMNLKKVYVIEIRDYISSFDKETFLTMTFEDETTYHNILSEFINQGFETTTYMTEVPSNE